MKPMRNFSSENCEEAPVITPCQNSKKIELLE